MRIILIKDPATAQKRQSISISLPRGLCIEIEDMARADYRTRSGMVRALLTEIVASKKREIGLQSVR